MSFAPAHHSGASKEARSSDTHHKHLPSLVLPLFCNDFALPANVHMPLTGQKSDITMEEIADDDSNKAVPVVSNWVHMQETYAYAKTLLDCATANPDGRPRALLVGGGIANFTDVAATFKGIIKVRARLHQML